MKKRYLLIISMMLVILTLGAASASENITSDNNLAAEDATDDSIAEIDDSIQEEEDTLLADSNDDAIGYEDDDFDIRIYSNYVTEYPSYGSATVVEVYAEPSAYGKTLDFYVNDEFRFNNTYNVYYSSINANNLGIFDYGEYKIDVKLGDALLDTQYFYVSPYEFKVSASPAFYDYELGYGDSVVFEFRLPDDATGKLTLTLNGKTYDVYYDHGWGQLAISTNGWNLGKTVAVAKYAGDSNYSSDSRNVIVELKPKIQSSFMNPDNLIMCPGEKESISFIAPSGTSGKVEVLLSQMGNLISATNVTITNGVGSYSLPNLNEGSYEIYITGQIANYDISKSISIYVVANSPEYSASVSSTEIVEGNNVNLMISGPGGSIAIIFIDNKPAKYCFILKDKINEAITGLSVGTHKIKVYINGPSSYTNTFIVNVKKAPAKDVVKLTLSKVKVKKSAKKLVIKATLKINGKAKKGLKVKFKFGKKSYTAKTSAKGVAKITVKKTVLKKLKVGKKITYKATYGKTVKKITVKVKK